jgi:hypothetical protein
MSIKLSDTQLLMLSAAAQREDRCIAAPPNLKGAASQKVAAKLVAMGLAKEVKAGQRSHVWRRAVSAFRVWTCRRVGPISGGPLESRLAVERKRDAPAGGISTGSQRLSSAALRFARRKFDLLSAPIETGRKGPGLEPGSAVTRTGLSKTQGNSPRKRNFAPRDRRRVPPPHAENLSLYGTSCALPVRKYRPFRQTEIPSISTGWLVELRGFEPLTSAVRLQRSPI